MFYLPAILFLLVVIRLAIFYALLERKHLPMGEHREIMMQFLWKQN